MSLDKAMTSHAAMIASLTTAVAAAAKSGMSHDDIKAALDQIAALVESADE